MLTLFVCLFALIGCAFRAAMDRGETAEAQGDWSTALSAYREALRIDGNDPLAKRAVHRAQEASHGDALRRFDAALKAGDLGAARRHLATARRAATGSPATDKAAAQLADARSSVRARTLLERAEVFSGKGDDAKAATLAAKAFTTKDTPQTRAASSAMALALAKRAEAKLSSGDYRAALAHRTLLKQLDLPPTKTLSAQQRSSAVIRTHAAWAKSLSLRATKYQAAKQPSLAYIALAHRAALLATPTAAKTASQAYEALDDRLLPRFVFDARGPAKPRAEVDRALGEEWGHGGALFAIDVDVESGQCERSRQDRVGAGRYQTGTQATPNPVWNQLSDKLDRRLDSLQAASRFEEEALEKLKHAERQQAKIQAKRRHDFMNKRKRLLSKLRRAKTQESEAWDALSQLDKRQRNRRRGLERQLEVARKAVEKVYTAIDRLDAAQHRAYQEPNAITYGRRRLHDARRLTRQARDRSATLRRKLRRTAPELEVPAYETLRYRITHWTRRCTVALSYRVDGPMGVIRDTLTASRRWTDSAHDAQLELGLDEDPLQLGPRRSTALTALHYSAGKRLRKRMRALRAKWREILIERAEQLTVPEQAAEAALAALAISDRRSGRLDATLLKRFDVDTETLAAH